MILVDTNVLLDVVTADQAWEAWSQHQLDAAALRDELGVPPIVYAELSIAFEKIDELDRVLNDVAVIVVEAPRAALFLAGKAFQQYRKRGGTRTSLFPDFLVGAHAAVTGSALLTRDGARYRTYFPGLTLIAP